MFCTNCGSPLPDQANFCVGCGSPVRKPFTEAPQPVAQAPAAQAPIQPPPPQAAPIPTQHTSATVACQWCRAVVPADSGSCPKCGATLDARIVSDAEGWSQLPGRKDMAKLQFGNSFCQIEGLYVPVADMNLAPEDSVYFSHHLLLWRDPQVNVTVMPLSGAWKRMFAGMPLVMTQAHGPGHIAFSRDAPGEMVALPLQPGQSVDVKEHLFLTATGNITYDWFSTNIWFKTQKGSGNDTETETHYPIGMFMDRFYAPSVPGLLLLHASGNVFVKELGPYQTILVKPSALIFKDPTVQMQLHFEHPRAGIVFGLWGNWSNRYLWLRVSGPGRVAISSVFHHLEGESGNITNFSYATEQRW
jgi:uncharacterized protein (AIM24 family)/RNA polymerase subunit RPABC4/transcription elongation factor Spt4